MSEDGSSVVSDPVDEVAMFVTDGTLYGHVRPHWFKRLISFRRPEDKRQKNPYSPVLEVRYALNDSRSKFLVVALDFERLFAPIVSIENPQGKGVILTMQEWTRLMHSDWTVTVRNHMDVPSYRARNTYTSRHEFRCAMVEGKPGIQISPLRGEGGYCFMGQVTWERLIAMAPMIHAYLRQLQRESTHIVDDVYRLVVKHALGALQTGEKSLSQIKGQLISNLPLGGMGPRTTEYNPYNARLIQELSCLHGDMTASMIVSVVKEGGINSLSSYVPTGA